MCARRRTYFLLRRQKKVGKEKATPSLRPPYALSGERGQPAMLGAGVVPMNSLRSSNSAQTAAASWRTKRVCPSAHTPTPAPALLGAASRGGERGPHGCCFAAAPGVGYALRAADMWGVSALTSRAQRWTTRPSEAMARVEPAPTPF